MLYTKTMNCLKKSFIHFLFFSFFMTLPCAGLLAEPGQEDFPPLPPDQDKPFFNSPKDLPKDSPKDPDNIIHYRGNRIYKDNDELVITDTKCQRLDENTIALEIIFNQSINPRSMDQESIYIDNEPLPDGTRFLFNRKGDTIKILIIMNDDEFSMKVQNIRSFNGNLIEPAVFELELEETESPESELLSEEEDDFTDEIQ